MTDEQIGKALRRLPRAEASPRFKSDVLRAVRSVEEQPRVVWRMLAATAMMLMLVVGTYGASLWQKQQRMRALRAETRQIASELQRVKAKADAAQPIVVLENGDTRVVVANEATPIYY